MEKSQVFAELEKRGVAQVVVQFSGGGDEGGVETITLYNAKREQIGTLQESYPEYNPETRSYKPITDPDANLAEALSKPVYDKYHSFAGEFHVNGEVTWDTKAKTVKMDGQESHEEWQDFNESF